MMPVRRNQTWLPGIFNDFFGNEWMQTRKSVIPAVNIIENDNEFKVELAVPGLTKKDFIVKIDEDNNLQVSMEKKEENKEGNESGKYLRREFSHTQFKQTMILPENVDIDKIEAKVESGILEISIPKKTIVPEEKAVKEIAIK
ncbi:MAG: Hsp20/alpha crystallin family protein [Bacteroidales bacterium]|jgi:HSP20 family protein|nr:Hsp20/alpha crystallin family protein [Bacteroidales bacterium]